MSEQVIRTERGYVRLCPANMFPEDAVQGCRVVRICANNGFYRIDAFGVDAFDVTKLWEARLKG